MDKGTFTYTHGPLTLGPRHSFGGHVVFVDIADSATASADDVPFARIFTPYSPDGYLDHNRREEDARRFIALWQACAGVPTEVLEASAAHFETGAITEALRVVRRIWMLREAETDEDLKELSNAWRELQPVILALGGFAPEPTPAAPPYPHEAAIRDASKDLWMACRIALDYIRYRRRASLDIGDLVWMALASAAARAERRDFRPSEEIAVDALLSESYSDDDADVLLAAAVERKFLERQTATQAVVELLVSRGKKPMSLEEQGALLQELVRLGESALGDRSNEEGARIDG